MEGWYEAPVRELVEGRRVVLAGGVPAMWTNVHDVVRRLGAVDVAVFATEGRGAGAGPDCTTIVVEPPDDVGGDTMSRIRWGNAAVGRPPCDAIAALEAFDPDRTAVVIGTFLNEAPTLDGRPVLNHRRPAWLALDDKTVVDEVWARAGIAAAPAGVVPLDEAWAAARSVDRGSGTVWAGDATGGWHGGATLTEWVRTEEDAEEAVAALQSACARARVMPFLEGIPCSIHGIVCDDGVVALRPVEMVTMRQGRRFVYAGCSTYWDPPDHVRDEMREAAKRVGALLAEEVAFRGAFTIDGVATVEGFLPTELNPRAGAGLVTMGRGLPHGFPLLLVVDMIAAGRDVGRSAALIEDDLLAAADAARSGGTWRMAPVEPARSLSDERLWFDGTRWTSALAEPDDGSTPSASVTAMNGFVRCAFDADRWPVGPSVAPAAVAFYGWCDEHLGTSIGPLTPAPDVTA